MKQRNLAALGVAATLASYPLTAQAVPEPTTGVELNHPLTATVGVPVAFDFAYGEEGFAALKELRAEMWDKNPPFKRELWLPGNTRETIGPNLRDVAKHYGYSTKDEYVNSLVYDHGHTRIAVQRAVERGGPVIGHSRPYNSACELPAGTCWPEETATINGVGGIQNLGYDPYRTRMSAIVKKGWGGPAEYQGLLAADGKLDGNGGHLWHLLNPEVTHWGFATVYIDNEAYMAASMGKPTGVTSYPRGFQQTVVYRAAHEHETPTGILSSVPRKADPYPPKPPWGENNVPYYDNETGELVYGDYKPSNPTIAGIDTDGSSVERVLGIISTIIALAGLLAGLVSYFGFLGF